MRYSLVFSLLIIFITGIHISTLYLSASSRRRGAGVVEPQTRVTELRAIVSGVFTLLERLAG